MKLSLDKIKKEILNSTYMLDQKNIAIEIVENIFKDKEPILKPKMTEVCFRKFSSCLNPDKSIIFCNCLSFKHCKRD